jgi:hypothetical protein
MDASHRNNDDPIPKEKPHDPAQLYKSFLARPALLGRNRPHAI